MAWLMRASETNVGMGWSNSSSGRDAGRRTWASTAWLLGGTIFVAVLGYSISLKVANERREIEKMERVNTRLAAELKALDAELRVRMRMPQLQRWNDTVLGMVPISATQYLNNPVMLANYGTEPQVQKPQLQLAVRDEAPAVAVTPGTTPLLVKAEEPVATVQKAAPVANQAVRPAPQQVAVHKASHKVVAPPPVQSAPSAAVRPAAAPADLLLQVEMTFGPADGANN